MMQTCVFCRTDKDLNTRMTVTLDDKSVVEVVICDEHAEDATVKTTRSAYLEYKKQIDEVMKQAEALGLKLTQSSGGITVATGPKPKPQVQKSAESRMPIESLDINDPSVVPTSKIDTNRGMQSVGGVVDNIGIQSISNHDLSGVRGKLPAKATEGHVKLAVVEGRSGQPLVIPSKRVDGLGTTRVNVANVTTDAELQRRFKNMANRSLPDEAPVKDFARSGYQNSLRTCPVCHGSLYVRQGKEEIACPKCRGSGVYSLD